MSKLHDFKFRMTARNGEEYTVHLYYPYDDINEYSQFELGDADTEHVLVAIGQKPDLDDSFEEEEEPTVVRGEDEDGNTVGLEVADPNVNVEEEAILQTLFTELVEYLGKISPRYAKIVTLGRQDYSKEQIIAELGLKPSRGYQEINAAKELTKKFLEL